MQNWGVCEKLREGEERGLRECILAWKWVRVWLSDAEALW